MNLIRYVLDANDQPTPEPDLLTWAAWMGIDNHQTLVREQVGRVRVSTIFLGLDHNWLSDDGHPLLFETFVHGGKLDGECERYSTKEQAIAGHARMVQRVGASA